jgi:CO dehydrogenase/acetyl-CoA synthase gamma subunit (corrinoid Fe-S protein)
MDYTVDPGLYALGLPDGGSPVLVTANYKMSFDCLREALPSRNVWILVLDTLGINVWCAVIAVQSFGDFLGFNPHCHILVTDDCF